MMKSTQKQHLIPALTTTCLLIGFLLLYACESSTNTQKNLPNDAKANATKNNDEDDQSKASRLFENAKLQCRAPAKMHTIRFGKTLEVFCLDPHVNKNGAWARFDENERLVLQGEYKRDFPDGIWTSYHPNGKINDRGKLIHGKRDGKWIEYYPNGAKRSEKNYQRGLINGPMTIWYLNGQRLTTGLVVDSKEEGKWQRWDEDGQLSRECWLKNGQYLRCKYYKNGAVIEDTSVPAKPPAQHHHDTHHDTTRTDS